MAEAPNVSELAVAEIERRIQWRAMPAFIFLVVMAALLGVAYWPTLFPPRHYAGLPDDPDVFAAAGLLRAHVTMPASELRFESALTGDVVPGLKPGADLGDRLDRAAALLQQAAARLKHDPRLAVARAALDLSRHRYAAAERDYRRVLERCPNYPEARLGLGVTLALSGEIDRNALGQRQRYLRAIAQLAAVTPRDAEYEEALYDRALLLARVGRHAEAARYAREYLARDARVGVGPMRALIPRSR